MKTKSLVLAAALAGGLLSTTAFAINPQAHQQALAGFDPELPEATKVVAPIGLPPSHDGATIMLSLTIDETGRPHDIKVVSKRDQVAAKCLVNAVSQWRFTPAHRNGMPVSVKVLLPVELERSARS